MTDIINYNIYFNNLTRVTLDSVCHIIQRKTNIYI